MSNIIATSDIINQIAEANGLTKVEAKAQVTRVVDAIVAGLTEGNTVRISGLGAFSVVERAARTGRNPQTGDALEIAASKAVKFKVTKTLKDVVNGTAE